MLRLSVTAYGWQFETGPRDRKKCLRGLEVENSRRVTTPETLSRSDGEDKPIDQQTPLLCRTPGRIGEHVALDRLTAHAPRKQMQGDWLSHINVSLKRGSAMRLITKHILNT